MQDLETNFLRYCFLCVLMLPCQPHATVAGTSHVDTDLQHVHVVGDDALQH